MASGDLQGSVLEPGLFNNISINDIDKWIEFTLRKFADDTNLSGAVDTLKDGMSSRGTWISSRSGPYWTVMRINKIKCKVLLLDWSNS